jgi:serine/threonine protein kinase
MIVSKTVLETAYILKVLGKGNYGEVYLARLQDGQQVAIKTQKLFGKSGEFSQSIALEIDALRKLQSSKFIVQLRGLVIGSFQVTLLLEAMTTDLTRYVETSDIQTRLDKFSLFYTSMLSALAACESLGINHYDIKPHNILVQLEPMCFKLADFGISRSVFKGKFSPHGVFTVWFRPPEFLGPNREVPPFVSDVWAFGVTAYFYLIGQYLFMDKDPNQLLKKITENTLNGKYKLPVITQEIRFVDMAQLNRYIMTVQDLLVVDPTSRPLASKFVTTPVDTLTQPQQDLPRKMAVRWLATIWCVNQELQSVPAVYIITVEILGRYLDLLGFYPEKYETYVIACHYLAIAYIDNPLIPLRTVSSSYKRWTSGQGSLLNTPAILPISPPSPPDSDTLIYQALQLILERIEFQVYNLNLTPGIQSVETRLEYLAGLTKEHYLRPVREWFT